MGLKTVGGLHIERATGHVGGNNFRAGRGRRAETEKT